MIKYVYDDMTTSGDDMEPPQDDPNSFDSHMGALGEVASAMKDHLMTGGIPRTTWNDYLRVLERLKDSEDSLPRIVKVQWIDSEQKRKLEEEGKL